MGEGELGNLEIVDGARGEGVQLAQWSDRSAADILRDATRRDGQTQTGTVEETRPDNGANTQDRVVETDRPQQRETTQTREFKSVVEIDFNNMHRNNLNAPFYEAVKVNGMPEGVVPSHYVDDNGHYFYFKAKEGMNQTDKGTHWELDNGTKFPKGKFYYSPFAKQIEVHADNGKTAILDLRLARRQADAAYEQLNPGNPHKAYQTYEARYAKHPSLEGRPGRTVDPITYMTRLSGMVTDHIDKDLELSLSMAENSANPYLSIYAADLLVVKAMQPIIRQFQNGQITMTNDQNFVHMASPETRQHLQHAIRILENVTGNSDIRLRRNDYRPQRNTLNPLHNEPYPNDTPKTQEERDAYFRYWGGAKDQAAFRQFQIQKLDQLLSILGSLELPPAN